MKRDKLPRQLVYLLLALLPFERIPSIDVTGISLRPSIVVAALLIVVVARRSLKIFYPDTLFKKALFGFLGVNLLSALLSNHPGRALQVTGFLAFVAALGLAVSWVVPELDLRIARRSLLIGAVLVCAVGLYQFFGDLGGLPTTVTGLKPAYSSQVFGFPRVQGTALEPLYFANYLLLPIAVAVGTVMRGRAMILGLLYLVALLTLSRGGVAAMAVLTVILLAVKIGQRQYRSAGTTTAALGVAMVLAYGLLAYAVPALTNYRQSRDRVVATYAQQLANYEIGNTGVDRARTRQFALELFKARPIFGSGPGTYGYYANERDPNLPVSQIVNNELYELLAEVGVLGLMGFIILAAILGWTALKTLWRKEGGETWAWRLALLAFLVAMAVQYWSFSTLYIIHLWVAIGLLAGLLVAPRQLLVKGKHRQKFVSFDLNHS